MAHFYSHAQLARALVAKQAGRPVDPHLSRAVAEMPRVKTPLELEVERLRGEVAQLRSHDYGDFEVEGFKGPTTDRNN